MENNIFLYTGSESLLIQDNINNLKSQYKKSGFDEIIKYHLEPNTNWDNLIPELQSGSLFSLKQIIEISITKKPNKSQIELLKVIFKLDLRDKIIIVNLGNLDTQTRKTKWFTELAKHSQHTHFYDLKLNQYPQWIKKEIKKYNLVIDQEGINCLIHYSENNLFSLAQSIEKYYLTFGSGKITVENIKKISSNNSKFDIFQCIDTALSQNINKTKNILLHCKNSGVEPILLLWAFSKDCRVLAQWETKKNTVWAQRQSLFKLALKNHPDKKFWENLISIASHTDKVIKGLEQGNVWLLVNYLYCSMAGASLPNPTLENIYG